MSEKKQMKVSLTVYLISILILIAVCVALIMYIVEIKETKIEDVTNSIVENVVSEGNSVVYVPNVDPEHIVLYNGYHINVAAGVQTLTDMEINDINTQKYNTNYYNYEKGTDYGLLPGSFGEETYEGVSVVTGTKKVAMTTYYNAIPREFEEITELPEELSNMADNDEVRIQAIDLDGDSKKEYIVAYKEVYTPRPEEDALPQVTSEIILFDSEWKEIDTLVNLRAVNDVTALSLDDVEYVDINCDDKMEILINIPMYEGSELSIIKYENGVIEGETNYEASIEP